MKELEKTWWFSGGYLKNSKTWELWLYIINAYFDFFDNHV
jgi:hypothetical protein